MREEVQRIPQKCNGLWDHSEQLYANASDNLEEKDQFLETHSYQNDHEEIENLNRPIAGKEIESVISLPTRSGTRRLPR